MIYIVYGLSGPLKRVLVDSIPEKHDGVSPKITINRRGIYGKKPEKYDTERELEFCTTEDKLKECGQEQEYIYDYGDYKMAINKKQLDSAQKNDDDYHIVICHDPKIITQIKNNYSNTQVVKVSFPVSNVLDLACEEWQESDPSARAKKVTKIIRKVEKTIEFDIEIVQDIYVSEYAKIGNILYENLCKKLTSKWKYLLNAERLDPVIKSKEKQDDALVFVQDYNRVINSAAFRRLQDKAQVFPLEKTDYPRTRLTHSIECAAIAEELGVRAIKIIKIWSDSRRSDFLESCYKIPTILKTAALLHDMGNPPFGHFGEDIIKEFFVPCEDVVLGLTESKGFQTLPEEHQADFLKFDGNTQMFRLVTSLDNVHNEYRLNLTYATLAVACKYTTDSKNANKTKALSQKKPGYFISEKEYFDRVQENVQKKVNLQGKRHPLTFLSEAADDISYLTSDLQDANRQNIISW